MKSEEKQRLIEEGKKGLLALAELEISGLEESNQQLKSMFDKDDSTVPTIDSDFHNRIGRRYDAIVKIYGDFDDNFRGFQNFTERYRRANEERLILLLVYKNRKENLTSQK